MTLSKPPMDKIKPFTKELTFQSDTAKAGSQRKRFRQYYDDRHPDL